MTARTKAVAKRSNGNTELAQYSSYEEDAGLGYENTTQDDFSIPRLYMLQNGSPQVMKKGDSYVEGAEPGMMFNSVTKEVFERLTVIPVLYRRTWVEWTPRDDGGGFIAEHLDFNPDWERQQRGPYLTPNGTEVNDTRSFFLLHSGQAGKDKLPTNPTPIILSMTSTQIRRASDWLTTMNNKRGRNSANQPFPIPLIANCYTLESDFNENDQGQWYGWVPKDSGVLVPKDHELYIAAKAFRQQVEQGIVKVEPPAPESESENVEDTGNM